jgi:hypothetical protein
MSEAEPLRVVYIDGDTGAVVHECSIEEVPPEMRYHESEKGKVPIVRVVATTAGNQRTIREYGPGEELLRWTVQLEE